MSEKYTFFFFFFFVKPLRFQGCLLQKLTNLINPAEEQGRQLVRGCFQQRKQPGMKLKAEINQQQHHHHHGVTFILKTTTTTAVYQALAAPGSVLRASPM